MDLDKTPRWGDVFSDEYIDPDNMTIMNEGARRLDRRRLNHLKRLRSEFRFILHGEMSWWQRRQFAALPRFEDYERALHTYEKRRKYHQRLKDELQKNIGDNRRRAIYRRMRWNKRKAARLAEYVETARLYMSRSRYVEKRLAEHDTAIQFERELERDKRGMKAEARYFRNKTISAYSRLGYKNEILSGKSKRIDKVKIEKIWAAEDELIFKIAVSRISLFGSITNMLPERVKAYDLVKPETLREIEAALERPVYSPHNGPEHYGSGINFEHGAYICVCRIDHRGGLVDYIEWRKQMAHYPNEARAAYPIPLGQKRGRKLNWGYIDNKSPHYMFNGLTGSGKTNAMVGCLAALVSNHPPSELRVMVTDLKRGGNFRAFSEIQHNILGRVIFTTHDLMKQLHRILQVLHRRQEIIGEKADDIDTYNRSMPESARLARLLVVIDEYSETLQLGDDKEIKSNIDAVVDSIARLGRSCGIHLFIGNQQPYADYMPKQVRGNITYHLTGYQMTMGASMSTVGDKSATQISKHPGRMIVNTGKDRFEVQLPHCTPDDIAAAVEIANQWESATEFDWVDNPHAQPDEIVAAITTRARFSEDDLARSAIRDYAGVISCRKIWDANRDRISLGDAEKLRDNIVDAGGWIVDDNVYLVVKHGKGYILKLDDENTVNTENTENIENTGEDVVFTHDGEPVYEEGHAHEAAD